MKASPTVVGSLTVPVMANARFIRLTNTESQPCGDRVTMGSSKLMAQNFAGRLAEAVGLSGAPTRVVASAKSFFHRYLDEGTEIGFVGRAKYLVCFFMAKITQTPVKPDATFDICWKQCGHFKTWSRDRLRFFNKRNVSLWQMIFKGKSCADPLTEVSVYHNIREHKAAMDAPHDYPLDTEDDVMSALEEVLERMRETVEAEFNSGDIMSHAPSFNASLDTPGKFGGAHAQLMDLVFFSMEGPGDIRDVLRPQYQPEVFPPGFKEFNDRRLSMRNRDCRGTSLWRVRGGRSPYDIRHDVFTLEEQAELIGIRVRTRCDGGTPYQEVSRVFSYGAAEALWEERITDRAQRDMLRNVLPQVRYSAVIEPLKIRGITISEGAGTYCVKWFQSACMKFMKTLPCFPSSRGPVDATHVTALLRSCTAGGLYAKFESSDFKGATDLLSHRLSQRILRFLCHRIPEPYRSIIMNDNMRHFIRYPLVPKLSRLGNYLVPEVGPDGSPVGKTLNVKLPSGEVATVVAERLTATQHEGNLMGQITSFVLLCLINLGLHLSVVKDLVPGASHQDALESVIINGDDRLAYTFPEFAAEFWRRANRVGLFESLGKSYLHSRYANINSQAYIKQGDLMVRVPVPNLGLLYGFKKVAGEPFNPALVVGEFAKGLFWGKERFMKRFFALHRMALARTCRGRNLFLPCWLGGMGNDAPFWWNWTVSKNQARLAAWALAVTPNRTASFGPSPHEEPDQSVPALPPWQKLPAPFYLEDEDITVTELEEFEERLKKLGFPRVVVRESWAPTGRRCLCCSQVVGPNCLVCPVCLMTDFERFEVPKRTLKKRVLRDLKAATRGRIFVPPGPVVKPVGLEGVVREFVAMVNLENLLLSLDGEAEMASGACDFRPGARLTGEVREVDVVTT